MYLFISIRGELERGIYLIFKIGIIELSVYLVYVFFFSIIYEIYIYKVFNILWNVILGIVFCIDRL